MSSVAPSSADDVSSVTPIPPSKRRVRWPELMFAITVVECVAAILLDRHFELEGEIPWLSYYSVWVAPFAGGLALMLFIMVFRMMRAGVENPRREIVTRLRAIDRGTYLEFVVPALMFQAFMAAHTTFKALLPHFNDYSADPFLMELDGILGFQPWELTHALIGPFGTRVVDLTYISWLAVCNLMFLAIMLVPRLAHLRGQVLLTYIFSWILLGSAMAILIPSVGPCFYSFFYPASPYSDLMDRLHAIASNGGLASTAVQARLWNDHVVDMVGFGSGITAMPSMHISVATITALFLRRLGWGWIGALWVLAIWIGSIHLGWHYASDGIVAAVLTALIWKGCAIYLRAHKPAKAASPETPLQGACTQS